MTHEMKLRDAYFCSIEAGRKDVEMRLHDEKRQAIQPGDTIVFTSIETRRTLLAQVLAKQIFPDFAALYAHYDKIRIGYTEGQTPDPKDMQQFYTCADTAKYGAVAIELRVIRK